MKGDWYRAKKLLPHRLDSIHHRDVVIADVVADNELLAWDSGTGKWVNKTAAEAGLSEGSPTIAHADTTGRTADDHHDEVHGHPAADHGGLGGLGDVADHPGYLTLDGARQMTGDLNPRASGWGVTGMRVRGFALTDKTTFTDVDTFIRWDVSGGTYANMGNPGSRTVWVTASSVGDMFGGANINRAGRVRIGISLDGGSSYTYGNGVWVEVDDSGQGDIRRANACAQHYKTGIPTDEVHVMVQAMISGGAVTDLDFLNGVLNVQMGVN